MQSGADTRVVEPQDAETVGRLITEMLADSPLAFGESLEDAQSRKRAEWEEIVERMVRPGSATAFLASDALGSCGFLCADSAFPETPLETVVIRRIWVAPRQRGSGLGRRLMGTAAAWAGGRRAKLLALGVTEMNATAMQFCEHLGYKEIGMRIHGRRIRPSRLLSWGGNSRHRRWDPKR